MRFVIGQAAENVALTRNKPAVVDTLLQNVSANDFGLRQKFGLPVRPVQFQPCKDQAGSLKGSPETVAWELWDSCRLR